MAARPPLLPRPMAPPTPEPEQEGPLWNTIRRQLYRSEVSHIKRLVGESLIQQNRVMWDEITSLRQILADFQDQNDELSERSRQQVQFCSSQHRDLLKRQAQIILEDVRSQAEACGHALEDLVPEFRDEHLRHFMIGEDCGRVPFEPVLGSCKPSPPMTPSTRPSSSGGLSGCSTPDIGLPPLPLGRALGVDELGPVAVGIREALEAEHEALLAAIGELMQRFEAEQSRRASTKRGLTRQPSTVELQHLVHKLQDLVVSPSLRALAITRPLSPGAADSFDPSDAAAFGRPISGGANVRRLKALIAQRRRIPTGPLPALLAVPESMAKMAGVLGTAGVLVPAAGAAPEKRVFDPFFDDPFA